MLTLHMRRRGLVPWALQTRPGEDRAAGRAALCGGLTKMSRSSHVRGGAPLPSRDPPPQARAIFPPVNRGAPTALLCENHPHFRGKATLLGSKWSGNTGAAGTERATDPRVFYEANRTLWFSPQLTTRFVIFTANVQLPHSTKAVSIVFLGFTNFKPRVLQMYLELPILF